MSKIWFAGDVHGKFIHVLNAIEQASVRPQAVIFLGDLEPQRPLREEYAPIQALGVACWHIHGNHDSGSEGTWRNLADGAEFNLDGRVVEIAGLRVGGLGGIFRTEVWYPQFGCELPAYRNYQVYQRALQQRTGLKRRLTPKEVAQRQDTPRADPDLLDASRHGKLLKHLSTIFPDTADDLAARRADILVTHEAPSVHPYGFVGIDLLARRMGVRLAVHGHQHDEPSYEHGEFQAMAVGLRGVRDLGGNVIVACER